MLGKGGMAVKRVVTRAPEQRLKTPPRLGPLHGDGEFDEGMTAVIQQGEVLEAQVEEGLAMDADAGQGERLALQLGAEAVDVVEVDVGVAEGVDEDARLAGRIPAPPS